MAENVRLNRRQLRTLAALMTSATMLEAARVAGISDRTLRRWMQEDEFRQALQARQSEVLAHSTRRLAALTEQAVTTLADGMESTAAPENVNAANSVFKNLILMRDSTDFESRLNALEAKLLTDENATPEYH